MVGETGWSVRVVKTSGIVFDAPMVIVAGALGRRVDASVGTMVNVVVGPFDVPGSSVKVAGWSGSNVVGEMGCTVKVDTLGSSGAMVNV